MSGTGTGKGGHRRVQATEDDLEALRNCQFQDHLTTRVTCDHLIDKGWATTGRKPCLNGGTCDDSSTDASIPFSEYRCRCVAGFTGSACEEGSADPILETICTPAAGQHMAAVAQFAAAGGGGALSVCLAASAAATVGTRADSSYGSYRDSLTVAIGGEDSTATISLILGCAAKELCSVRRPPSGAD